MNSLVSYVANAFPYMQDEEQDQSKHPNRNPLHLKDAIFDTLMPIHSINSITFDIGNENLERTHPYYHILQEAQVIRKRNRGTNKTKGSQALIEDSGKRDYTKIMQVKTQKGYKYAQEYRRNVRGARSLVDKSSHWTTNTSGDRVFVNREASYYNNIHYKYLDNMLDNGIVDMLASEFGMTRKSKQFTGLEDEFFMQEAIENDYDEATSMVGILNSFNEE